MRKKQVSPQRHWAVRRLHVVAQLDVTVWHELLVPVNFFKLDFTYSFETLKYILIYCLLRDSLNNSAYVASNGRIINDQGIGRI